MVTQAADDIRGLANVQVIGSASKRLIPNQMLWTMKVENRGKELEAVADEHLKITASLLKFLNEQGLEKNAIQTSQMEFGENMVYRNRERIKEGYVAATTVRFILKDFSLYQPLWKGAAKLGKVSIQSVDYQLKDSKAAQAELRGLAVKDAQQKAKSLAEALGSRIGPPLQIAEHQSHAAPRMLKADSFAEGANSSSTSPGTLEVSSTVEVTFKLLK
ncbi:SIMPL domain-containing protein [Rubritalea marina]|uniref:SIMPL domain-containing protein n=1 Tax=Rubritalea marina TaxID=361055 RepID=UPI0003661004|nr:SIMPL domain-containing protein [Rubritalea marina]